MAEANQISRDGVYVDTAYIKGGISILDILMVLIKRKKILLATIVTCVLISIAFTFCMPRIYGFTQYITLANYWKDGQIQFLYDAGEVLPVVQNVYLPNAVEKYNLSVTPKDRVSVNAFSAFLVKNGTSFLNKGDVGSVLKGSIYLYANGEKDKLPILSKIFQFVLDDISKNESHDLSALKLTFQNNLVKSKLSVQTLLLQVKKLDEQFISVENISKTVSHNVLENKREASGIKANSEIIPPKSSVLPDQAAFLNFLSQQTFVSAVYNYKLQVLKDLNTRQMTLVSSKYDVLNDTAANNSVVASSFNGGIVQTASPVSPHRIIIVIFGGIVGVVLGLILVLYIEMKDKNKT